MAEHLPNVTSPDKKIEAGLDKPYLIQLPHIPL